LQTHELGLSKFKDVFSVVFLGFVSATFVYSLFTWVLYTLIDPSVIQIYVELMMEKVNQNPSLYPKEMNEDYFVANFELNERWDSALFGEKQSRVVISFHPSNLDEILSICNRFSLPFFELGKVSSNRFKMSEFIDLNIEEISNVWKTTLLNELN